MFANLTSTPDMSVSREFFFIFNEFNSAKDYAIDITAVVLTVGGAFTVLGFLAVVLQQHGVNISSGLNTITAMPKWAGFLGLGLTTAGAILGGVISAMRIRKFLEQTYSKSMIDTQEITMSPGEVTLFMNSTEKVYYIDGSIMFVKGGSNSKAFMVGFTEDHWYEKFEKRLTDRGYVYFRPVDPRLLNKIESVGEKRGFVAETLEQAS